MVRTCQDALSDLLVADDMKCPLELEDKLERQRNPA
jgi:hypothetical protein